MGHTKAACNMFSGIDQQRVLAITDQERRWLDNIKKAFYHSDRALQNGIPEDKCLEELFKAIDTAKTLRRSLRGEDASSSDNKKRFIEFLALEIPAARPGAFEYELRDSVTGKLLKLSFGEIVYAIRCMIHENENLNAAENVKYHILLDWSEPNPAYFAKVDGERFVCNGFFLWHRLRQVLAKFITCTEAPISMAATGRCSMRIDPNLGSIRPLRENG
jgi:hypothetical protein